MAELDALQPAGYVEADSQAGVNIEKNNADPLAPGANDSGNDNTWEEIKRDPIAVEHTPELLKGTKYVDEVEPLTKMLFGQGAKGFETAVRLDKGQLTWALETFKGLTPDVAARVQKIADNRGVPFEQVAASKEEWEQDQEARKIYSSLFESAPNSDLKYPHTANWLANPSKMAQSKDDVEVLSEIEGLITKYKKPWYVSANTAIENAKVHIIKSGIATVQAIQENMDAIIAEGSNEEKSAVLTSHGPLGIAAKMYAALSPSKRENLARGLANIKAADLLREVPLPRTEGFSQKFEDFIGIIPQIAATTTAGLTLGPLAGAGVMSSYIFGSSYDELRDQGVTPERAFTASLGNAALQGALEYYGLSKLTGLLKSKSTSAVLSQLLPTITAEVGTEVLQAYPESASMIWGLAEKEGLSVPEQFGKFFTDLPQTTKQGLYEGALVAPFPLGGAAVRGLMLTYAKDKQLETDVKVMDEIERLATESKLRERNPQDFEKFLDGVIDQGEIPNEVYVPLETVKSFFQEDDEGYEEFLKIFEVQDLAGESEVTGGEIEISTSKLMANYADTEFLKSIKNDVRFGIDGTSVNEQKITREDAQRNVKELEAEFQRLSEQNIMPPQLLDIREQLIRPKKDGGYGLKAEDADAELITWLSGAKNLGAKRGESTIDWFNRYNPELRIGGTPDEQGISYNQQGEINRDENFDNWFQGSKVVDDQGAPLTVYHGTNEVFTEFKQGFESTMQLKGKGFYFTTNKEQASNFAAKPNQPNGNVMPVNVSLQNPLTVDRKELSVLQVEVGVGEKLTNHLKEQGYDGLIFDDKRSFGKEIVAFEPTQIKSVNNRGTYDPADPNILFQEQDGAIRAFHGTTHTIDKFDLETSNIENDYGKGIYFSNNEDDVSVNYAGEGPDLTQRLGLEAERIESEEGISPEEAKAKAREKLVGPGPNTIPVVINFKNPITIDPDGGNTFEFENEFDEEGELISEGGNALELYEAILSVSSEFDVDGQEIWNEASEKSGLFEDSVSAYEFEKVLRESESVSYIEDPETGALASSEFIRKVYEEMGFDGIIDKSVNEKFGSNRKVGKSLEGVNEDTVHYIAFSEGTVQSAITPEKTLLQDQDKITRGAVQFAKGKTIISLFDKSNMSTLLHEISHIFVEDIRDLQAQGLADEQLTKDYETLKKFAGGEFTTEGHEKIARAMERYFREGKAPSVELANAFRKFKQWLMAIYKNVRSMNVEINDEVRGVFDRILASEKEIVEAQEYYAAKNSLVDLITPTKKQQEKVEKAKQKADASTLDKLTSKYVRAYLTAIGGKSVIREEAAKDIENTPVYQAMGDLQVKGLDGEYIKGTYGDETFNNLKSKKVIGKKPTAKKGGKEVTYVSTVLQYGGIDPTTLDNEQKKKLRENGAYSVIRKDGFGFDQVAEELISEGVMTVPDEFNPGDYLYERVLARDFVAVEEVDEYEAYIAEQNAYSNLDELAVKYDFDGEQALLNALLEADKKSEAVTNRTNELLTERENQIRADLSQQETLPGEEAIHNDAHLSYLVAEAEVLSQKINAKNKQAPERLEAKVIKDVANEVIESKKVSLATRYDLYAKSEQRYAKEAYRAAADGDLVTAHEAKKKQILNHALVQAAIRARDDKKTIEKRYTSTNIKAKLNTVENEFADVAIDLIDSYKLSTGKPLKTGKENVKANIGELDEVLEGQTPEWILQKKKPEGFESYRDLTMAEFRELDATINSILHYGRDELSSIQDEQFKTVESLAQASMARMTNVKDKAIYNEFNTKGDVLNTMDGLLARTNMTEFVFERLDDYKFTRDSIFGPLRKLFNRGVKAETDYKDIIQKVNDEAMTHWGKIIEARDRLEKKFGGKEFKVPGLPVIEEMKKVRRFNWTVERLVSLLLNTGNEGNLQAIKNSYGYSDPQIARVFEMFTADELNAIQGLWDATNLLFPDLDKTNFKIYNRHLAKVDALPQTVKSADGQTVELKGGYYPLQFDHMINDVVGRRDEEDMMKNRTSGVFRTTKPSDGFTYARTQGHSLPPELSLNVWFSHIADTARYISHAEYMRDLNRLTQHKEWKEEVRAKAGRAAYDQIREWVKYQARPERRLRGPWEHVLEYQRKMATIAILGANLSVGVKQRLSMFSAAQEIGWKWIFQAYTQQDMKGSVLGLENSAMWDKVIAQSPYMKTRSGAIDREVKDVRTKISPFVKKFNVLGKEFTMGDVRDFMFTWIQMNDRATVGVVWLGAFNKAMSKNHDQKLAVDYADAIVRTTQPSALPIDLNSLQRSEGIMRMFTSFMTWTFKWGNRLGHKNKAWREGALSNKDYFRHVLYEGFMAPWGAAIISSLWVSGELPEWWEYMTSPAENAVAWIPFVRDIPGAIKYRKDVGVSPAFEGLQRAVKAGKTTWEVLEGDKEFSQLAWDIGRALEVQTGVPALKVARDIQRVYDNINKY